MDLERMKEFIVFSRHMNMTKAAHELLMTQSNLSKHIKQNENELGFKVLDRSLPRLGLTREGEQFLNFCHSTVDAYEVMLAECRQSQLVSRPALVVHEPSYSDATGEAYYRYIGEIRSAGSDIEIRYSRPYRRVLIDELRAGGIDIAIVQRQPNDATFLTDLEEEGFVAHALVQDCLTVWCNEAHPLAAKDNITMADLADYQILQPNDLYNPIRSLLVEYSEPYDVRLRFNMVESEQAAMFLSMRYPDCVYVLPKTITPDLRIAVRKDMLFRPLENDNLRFVSYVLFSKELLSRFPEIENLINAAPDEYIGQVE